MTAHSRVDRDAAALVLALAGARPPTLGSGRLVCIDGPAGSGKSTLAGAVSLLEPAARVVHMDDLYDGWDGLAKITDQLDAILLPLARGQAGRYRRYDWEAGRYAETLAVAPGPLLVLEGVGSASSAHAHLVTVTVWVTAPEDLRRQRGLDRDGPELAGHWLRWARDEALLFARSGAAERADIVVDGTGRAPATVRPDSEVENQDASPGARSRLPE